MEDILYLVNTDKENLSFEVIAVQNGIEVCKCKMSSSKDKSLWTISSWYTKRGFMHQGFGKKTLKKTLDEMNKTLGLPTKIEYIWNGANEYVYDWLSKNFGALSKCPLAVQKYSNDDDWESHIYSLNTEKFLNYFELF